MLKGQAGQFASQGAKPSIVAEILEADNISKLKQILKQAEQREMEAAERRELQMEDVQNKQLEIERAYKELEAEFNLLLQDHKYDREEGIEHVKGQYKLADTNTPGDTLDPIALEQTMQEREKIAQDGTLKDKEIKTKDKMNQRDNETKKYVADKSLQVARENKTQHELKSNQKTSK